MIQVVDYFKDYVTKTAAASVLKRARPAHCRSDWACMPRLDYLDSIGRDNIFQARIRELFGLRLRRAFAAEWHSVCLGPKTGRAGIGQFSPE